MAQERDLLLKVLADSKGGLTRAELLARLREKYPYLGPGDVERVLVAAGPSVLFDGDTIRLASEAAEEPESTVPTSLPRRFVSFDLESIVRPVVRDPYREQHVFQLGAVRFGPDREWVATAPEMVSFAALPDETAEGLIYSEELRERYERGKRPLADVLQDFRTFCDGADSVVAYNGVAHDFRLVEEEIARCELAPIWKGLEAPRRVDGLYLAHALWPIPPRQHRLKSLLERLEIDVQEMQWHDALDDSKMVVELLEHGAREFLPSLAVGLGELLASAGRGSDAWELLFSLAGNVAWPPQPTTASASRVLHEVLEAHPSREPLRPEPTPPTSGAEKIPSAPPTSLTIPASLREDDGGISLERLVRSVKGESAEPRDSQKVMVDQLRHWLETGAPALCEAPTGTGKSYAILAAALEWLDADPNHKVIISTFTKQLQSQLAADIEDLTKAAMPQLARAADMVKGAANRLSLRGLVLAITDLAEPDERKHRRGRQDFSSDPRYRDLVLFLLLRFLAQGKPTEEWEARSVDRVDVPAFFDEYCRLRLSLYLNSLSQSDNEDYGPDRGGIARYTITVREALDASRLIVANHALLLAHLDDYEDLGEQTLLFVDEAHELENSATSALSRELDSAALGELVIRVGEWARDMAGSPGAMQLADAVASLDRYLDDERLASAAMRAFDTAERDVLGRSVLRTVTVASPLQGDAGIQPMLHLAAELRTCRTAVGLISQAFRQIAEAPPSDLFEFDRFQALRSRTAEAGRALEAIVRDVDAVLAPPEWPTGGGDVVPETDSVAPGVPESDPSLQLIDEGTEEGTEVGDELVALESAEEDEAVGGDGDEEWLDEKEETLVEEGRSNRVVFAEEIEEFRPGRQRFYRFRLVTAPIELRREADWQRFKSCFARSYYVSATLRVAEQWDFVRNRLDLPESEVAAISLPSPFDAATQAVLVCFEDFPSWSEHSEAAMHTVAHQVGGYAREMINAGGTSGAMVLTTSRASAAGVFDWLARLRVQNGLSYPLISAGIEGNQRAVETFAKVGGALVGTRGLWQGVDIADPARLSLVWINKLPFAPFADPIIAARMALEVERAEAAGEEDPSGYANEHYYLPLAALALRQAAGRLIRSRHHRGVIVVSDRKLSGPTRLRHLYRQVFLGSLDAGLMRSDPETNEPWLGNVCSMAEGWKRIFSFFAEHGPLDRDRAAELSGAEEIGRFTELPETLAILEQSLSEEEESEFREAGVLEDELVKRSAAIGGHLISAGGPIDLRPKQDEAIRAVAAGKDVLAVLPTGYGKSYVFQLPALCLPGVTIVVSPLVSLMTDQALELNRTIAGRVRALVAPMRESNSRTGKSEVEEELKRWRSHGIKLVYLSPERLCQRQFQEWIRAGVDKGTIRRIAIDEAHTFVQWGDDFRPAVRRAEDFLRRLKTDHPGLQLIALTATANDTVREGLRSAFFGLERGASRSDFAFVQANPLRPEIALYRRVLPRWQGGPTSVAGLVERVVDQIDGHAIFYCLTVRQVEALHAHLSDYLQGHPVDVLRYHGRLTDSEKTGTANHFRQTPPRGEDGYRRMVVVATSAFGLGVDRPDIRCVFCISPPTDLAALHQQLGRASRDRAASPNEPGDYTAALAVSYPRAQRTISFMTQRRVSDELLARTAGQLLDSAAVFSAASVAEQLIDEDIRSGTLTTESAQRDETFETYRTAVFRVLAGLSIRRVVSDLGDFPKTIEIRRGDRPADTEAIRELVDAVMAGVPSSATVESVDLYSALQPRFEDEFPDVGSLWHGVLELHTLGYLDVSQRPNREQLTGIEVHSVDIPEELVSGLSSRQGQIQTEVRLLRDWFAQTDVCCNEGFRAYFAADELPPGTCAQDACRCSACWNRSGLPAGSQEPKLFEAFRSTNLRPASATSGGRRRSQDQLDQLVERLLGQNRAGLVENIMRSVLRGDDSYYSRAEQRRKPLWSPLLLSRVRGRKPGLRQDELRDSLSRLVDKGQVTRIGAFRYRLSRYVAQNEAKAAAEQVDAARAEVSSE